MTTSVIYPGWKKLVRADRLLSILLLLQIHKHLTTRQLAARLEVSERTIHRDMVALGIAGVPIVADRGANGGWRLFENYQTNLTGLNEAEIQALFLTRSPRLLADLGLDKAAEAGLIKLLAAMPAVSRSSAQDIRQRIHIDSASWRNTAESVPLLPILQEAIWQSRRLVLLYQRGDGSKVERLIEPLGLVAKGSLWYLVAGVDGEPRSYRVSRIENAALTDELFERPQSFDLASFWEQSSASFIANIPRYPAKVRVRGETLARMQVAGRFARIEHIEPPDSNGWRKVSILFEEEHNAVEYILSFGDGIEAIEPAALRKQVFEAAQKVVALYLNG